jgi:hypothetical protein
MATLGGDVPSFDGLLEGDHPKDTEVVIREEGPAGQQEPLQSVGQKRGREDDADDSIVMPAHWTILWCLSPYFRAKVSGAAATVLQWLAWRT